MKQYNYDNKKFKHLILFIGRDLDYAKSLIDVLISKKEKNKIHFFTQTLLKLELLNKNTINIKFISIKIKMN